MRIEIDEDKMLSDFLYDLEALSLPSGDEVSIVEALYCQMLGWGV